MVEIAKSVRLDDKDRELVAEVIAMMTRVGMVRVDTRDALRYALEKTVRKVKARKGAGK